MPLTVKSNDHQSTPLSAVDTGRHERHCRDAFDKMTEHFYTGGLIAVVDRLRKRFSIGRVCVVAGRGMIGAETIAELGARRLFYSLGVRERTDKLVRELVLDDPASFVPLTLAKRDKAID